MARKITEEACKALYDRRRFRKSNTKVDEVPVFGWFMWLHENAIAKLLHGKLHIRTAGYRTHTTKERLNGLSGVSVYQKNHEWYLNGELWENGSEWTEVS